MPCAPKCVQASLNLWAPACTVTLHQRAQLSSGIGRLWFQLVPVASEPHRTIRSVWFKPSVREMPRVLTVLSFRSLWHLGSDAIVSLLSVGLLPWVASEKEIKTPDPLSLQAKKALRLGRNFLSRS
uniref:Uncharacterized protein n=1 Tax=Rousettus aegyptiacus TaxID=9407 RepID=A0A7J8BEU3_ROUAE|nr:hypothetical protein HJG63_009844 [Rousettus aegyptiacus]